MALESDIAQMQSNPVLALFDAEALRLIAFSSDVRQLSKGDTLFRIGDVSDGGFLIVSGSVALAGEHSEEIHGPNALIGETALFAETIRPASARALEPTAVRRIPRHLVRRVLAEFPHTAIRVQAHLGTRIAEFGSRLTQIDAMLPAVD